MIGSEEEAETIVDAGGGLVSPGLWDANHHPYFGDHTPQLAPRYDVPVPELMRQTPFKRLNPES